MRRATPHSKLPGVTAAVFGISAAVCFGAGLPERYLLLPSFPPLISASCPQFPALDAPGVLCEDFDTDRNGVAGFQFTRLPIGVDPNDPLLALGDPNDDVLGYTQSTGPSPGGADGRRCSDDRGLGRLGCDAPQAEENDWHLHSRFEGPGSGYDPPNRPGIGAPEGGKAHSGFRSMHWGRHQFHEHCCLGDTTIRFRQISAFVLDPEVHLGPASTLQFWHMISLPDDENAGSSLIPPGTTFGGGQIQISLLGSDGRFEKWRRLTPAFNGYDSTTQDDVSICQFDPADDLLPPSDDTMCEHSPIWSDLGDVTGTDATCTTDTNFNDPQHKDCGAISSCAGGPGCTENGSIGAGVWARSEFDLSPFAGRRARLRWIGSMGGGWSFGVTRSFFEPDVGFGFYDYYDADDGWYADDIVLTDLRQAPLDCATDADQDGAGMCEDCNDSDPATWTLPGEARDLTFALDGSTLSWSPPSEPGADSLTYDLLRVGAAKDFWLATCLESDDSADLTAIDAASPPPGAVRYYLVRAQNRCTYGSAALGANSTGQAHDGRACP